MTLMLRSSLSLYVHNDDEWMTFVIYVQTGKNEKILKWKKKFKAEITDFAGLLKGEGKVNGKSQG